MPLPVTFANLPTGNYPASLLDQSFIAVANMGTTYCTATGTNTILLTVAPNQPIPTGYANGQQFAFIAPASNTGPVTIQVGALAAIPLRASGQPLAAGAIIAGTICDVTISGNGTTADLVGGSGTASGAFLPLTGGTLSGALTVAIPSGASNLYLNKSASGVANNIFGQTAGSTRWNVILGNTTAEGSGNVGSDFYVQRFDNTGTTIDTPIAIARSSGAVAIKGSSTNDIAVAGFVGEVISSNVTTGVPLTSGTPANVTSITLTAGDWNVQGEVWIAVGTGGATGITSAINTTSATLPAASALNQARNTLSASITASSTEIMPLRPAWLSVASATIVYLVGLALFPSGTTTATGNIWARRAR